MTETKRETGRIEFVNRFVTQMWKVVKKYFYTATSPRA